MVTHTTPLDNYCVLIIGESTDFPVLEGVRQAPEGEQPDLLLLLPSASSTALAEALASRRCWLKPVMAFGAPHPRADYYAADCNVSTLTEGLRQLSELLVTLESQTDYRHSSDRLPLTVLALANSRQTTLSASWDSASPQLIEYPLLCGIDHPLAILETLADLDLLVPQPFQRLHQCSQCESSRVNAREECPSCHSCFIEEAALVHHYSCGYLAPETEFFEGRQLVCPKCHKEMRHYGVDYDKPDTQYLCSACKETHPDPEVGFLCVDCGHHTPGASISTIDRYHYQLSADGARALQSGLLPNAAISDYVLNLNAYYSPREFLMLSQQSKRVAERYKRQLSGISLKITNIEELKVAIGRQTMSKSFVLLSEIIAQNLRDTDLLTSREQDIYMVLPETDAENVGLLVDRLRKQVKDTMNTPFEFTVERFDLENLGTQLDSLS
jgi:hypothetical protein